MKSPQTKTGFPRRDFLCGAAAIAGATVIAGDASALIAKPEGQRSAPLTLAYLDGTTLVPAGSLYAGDHTLDKVQITLRVFGDDEGLVSVTSDAFVEVGGQEKVVPFYAWRGGSQGSSVARFTAAVHPHHGVQFSVRHRGDNGTVESKLNLLSGTGSGAKLRSGSYVLMNGDVQLRGREFRPGAPEGPLQEAGRGYLVITIEPA